MTETVMAVGKIGEARLRELRDIERASGGVVYPEKVVEYARNPDTALHSAFCWDDTDAAHRYRVFQARNLLRVMVTVVGNPNGTSELIRVNCYASLLQDRSGKNEGGYRYVPSLIKSSGGRQSLLATALAELDAIREKYEHLTELAGVFDAVASAKRKAR